LLLKQLNEAKTDSENSESEHEERKPWLVLGSTLGLTIVLSAILDWYANGIPLGFFVPLTSDPATLSKLLYQVVVGVIALYIGYTGLKVLLVERRFSVEFLMSVAATGAAYLGFLFEAATVLLLYSLAEHFEHYIEDRARKTVESLSSYMPENANVLEKGQEKTVDVKQIRAGDYVLIRPGERIPLDGIVKTGTSSVDQSLVTGESTLLCKGEGDPVFAGTLNTDGLLTIRVEKEADGTLVSRIAKLIMESRRRKASMERLVDRFARFYVPIIVLTALFVAFCMPYLVGQAPQIWIYRSLILLVVSCPSAFILSVPATFFMAIATAARKGVIIKGGVYVEKMDKVKTVVFDKTGTLTLGQPSICEVNCSNQVNDQKALRYAAALEQYSNHPLAHGFVKRASEKGHKVGELEVRNVREVPGKGIVGYVDDCRVSVGNAELMREEGIDLDRATSSIEDERHTRIFVSIDRCTPPSFCLADQVRDDAILAVKTLKEAGTYTTMLTGDKAEIAEEVAKRLGVDETHAGLFPEEKLEIVDKLKVEKGLVAMVGDGINDAPSLAASDVGIAMGSSGVDVALESADIVLVENELSRIPYLQRLSKLSTVIAKQNITFSLGVKILLGALGFLGLVPLWFAVAAGDDGVTMLLLLNTLRIPRLRA